jgi:hypothetical protein
MKGIIRRGIKIKQQMKTKREIGRKKREKEETVRVQQ